MNTHLRRALRWKVVILSFLLLLTACSKDEHGADEHHQDDSTTKSTEHSDSDGHHETEHTVASVSEPGSHGHEAGGDDHHTSIAGQPGDVTAVTRTVQIDMDDAMRFTPAAIKVEQGETIRFNVKNSGELIHEFVVGTTSDILEHHELMKKFPGMEHEEDNMITLNTGETGDVVWQFSNAGVVDIACLQPGHYEAGMKGAITVSGQ